MSPGQVHAVALGITVVSEGLGMAGLSSISAADRPHARSRAVFAAGLNVATHTAFWYVQGVGLLPAEAATVVVEAAAYRGFCHVSLPKAAAWSVLLNLASLSLGLLAWGWLLR